MAYQQCRYKNHVEKIPIQKVDGQSYLFLDDVHDRFPGIQYFTCLDTPIPFEHDQNQIRLKPWRIRAKIDQIIDCHMPISASENKDNFRQEISEIHADLKKTLENTEILKKKADLILRQAFELEEYTIPRLFFVLPETSTSYFNPNDWFHLNYRLYFLCESEEDNGPHLAFHEGYVIKQPREFLRKYGTYLDKTLPIINHAIPGSSLFFENVLHNTGGITNTLIGQKQIVPKDLSNRFEQFTRILQKVDKTNDSSKMRESQFLEGPELREIEQFLKIVDKNCTFGNLYRSVTKEGHVRWICSYHYQKCFSDRKLVDLQDEFRDLGGEIQHDTAIITEQIGTHFPTAFNLIRRGLRVCSVVFKNISIEEKDFLELLTYLSQQSTIHFVEIEEVTVVARPFNPKKRLIVTKLDETVRANDKLTIQYHFSKLCNAFDSKLFEIFNNTSSRLIFRLQSREDLPSIELLGNSKTGFSLTISNQNEINHQTAVKNIFSFVPSITKLSFYEDTIPKITWTSFCHFWTTNQNLEELTMNCQVTVEQLTELFQSLPNNQYLKILDLANIHFPQMLAPSNSIVAKAVSSILKNALDLEFAVQCLSQNPALEIVRLPNCLIDRNTDLKCIENFLRTTTIRTLGLQLQDSTEQTECLRRFAQAINANETLQSIELHNEYSSASFHRAVTQISKQSVATESFYSLCKYPVLYKELREISLNFELDELEVTMDEKIPMKTISSSIETNSTVTQLRFDRRILTNTDIDLLGRVLHSNTKITHLILSDINLSITDLRQLLQFLQNSPTLRVLEIKNCVAESYIALLIEQIKSFEAKNPFLKIVYE